MFAFDAHAWAGHCAGDMSLSFVLAAFDPQTGRWVHDLSPFLVRFGEGFGVRYYGLAYLAGFAAAWWMLRQYAREGLTKLTAEQTGDLMTALIVGVLLGGRLGYFILYQPATLWRDPLEIVRVWDGGMASHGGFVGVAAALLWCARRFGMAWRHLADLVASVTGFGLFFGRVANFINGELWGKVSSVPWAMVFPASAAPDTPTHWIEPRHPSQLYAAVLEGLCVLAVVQPLVWRTRWLREAPGRVAGAFLLAYAVARVAGECFREPDAALILGLSRGMFYSVFIAAAGCLLLRSPARAAEGGEAFKAPRS